jgi:hypothetical protein
MSVEAHYPERNTWQQPQNHLLNWLAGNSFRHQVQYPHRVLPQVAIDRQQAVDLARDISWLKGTSFPAGLREHT